jgi:hypothetical protein
MVDENNSEISPPEDSGEGVQSEATSDLDRADEIVERRARILEREERLMDRKEAFKAREMVGGGSEAGAKAEEPKEESPEEYAKRVMSNAI